ncbi:MAG: hypothetical protein C0458_04455 [Methylobacterium sp.]|nr:hypothetical protein [Methylobacterium sp.]
MRPYHATLAPGLPPAGATSAFIGRDAQGSLYLLRWHDTNGWEALGWVGAGKAAMPALRHPAGEDQGLIVGHIEIAGSGAGEGPPAGSEGAAGIGGPRPADRHPEGVRALGPSSISQARLAQAASRIAKEAAGWASDALDMIGEVERAAPRDTVRRFLKGMDERLRYLERQAFGSEADQ